MNKITKINPIAKLLGDSKYKNKTIPNKKKSKLDKLAKKEPFGLVRKEDISDTDSVALSEFQRLIDDEDED